MQLSKFTDYSFRALIYLARNRDKRCTIEELAARLETSHNHMKKVICKLAANHYVKSAKGRTGGLFLGDEPENIVLSDVLLLAEGNMNLLMCYNSCSACPLQTRQCALKKISRTALQKFIDEFKNHTLRDIL
ncbi:MAG: Rrf2 family transcriptional regulator [Opitutales bacterium]|nr:Rrf2 family transcriptional regulator [Opitutales bacterium]